MADPINATLVPFITAAATLIIFMTNIVTPIPAVAAARRKSRKEPRPAPAANPPSPPSD